jgi:hypothetical protein
MIFYCLKFETSLFVASYDSQGHSGGTRPRLHTTKSQSYFTTGAGQSRSQSYVTADGQSASLSWNKAPIWGLQPDFYYCQTVAGLLMWGALSDVRTGLSFTIAAGPRQRSHFQVRVPWDSWPHFIVSDLRLPCLSPSKTRRVTVEVFDLASTREYLESELLYDWNLYLLGGRDMSPCRIVPLFCCDVTEMPLLIFVAAGTSVYVAVAQ